MTIMKQRTTKLTELEQRILCSIQKDIPLTQHPYAQMADNLNIDEETFLKALRGLCDRGIVRRFGATIKHQKSGFQANAMIAWQVKASDVDTAGKIMASFKQVSHCYHRTANHDWPYNLYTMVHAKDETSCRNIARRISEKTGVDNYTLLFSVEELKKTSMQYFPSDCTE